MPYKCHLPDGAVVDLGDLPFEEWTGIAAAGGDDWWKIYQAPMLFPSGAMAIIAACARFANVEVPPSGWATAGTVTKIFQQFEEDLPGSFQDGIPLEDQGDPETT